MLKPRYGLDRRGLLRAAAAGVVGASLPKGVSPASESISEKPVGFGKAKSVLIVLILAHVAGAAFHGLVLKDGVFSRMWPPFSARKQ